MGLKKYKFELSRVVCGCIKNCPVCFPTYSAGTDTTRFALLWIIQYLAKYPEVQERAQKEVDDIVGMCET